MPPSTDNNGSEPAAAAKTNSSAQPQVNVSLEVLSSVRDHIAQINELLQRAAASSEGMTEPSAVTEPKKTSVDTEEHQKDKTEPNPKQDSTGEDEEGDEKTQVTRKGRVLVMVRKDSEAASSVPDLVKRKEGEFAFTYLKNMETNGTFKSSLIEIRDPELRQLLKKVRIQSRPTFYRAGREEFPELLFSPYEDVVWIYDRLKNLDPKKFETSAETLHDLNLLLGYVAEDSSLTTYFDTRRKRPNQIAWDHIWTLFPAGTEIVARPYLDTPQILGIQFPPYRSGANCSVVEYDQNERWDFNGHWGIREHWRIKAWCYDHDGRDWLRVCHVFNIRRYDGERSIDELQCYPLANDKDPGALRDLCASTGDRFAKLFKSEKPLRFNYDNHVMIDKATHNRVLFPSENLPIWWKKRYLEDDGIELVTNKVSQEVIVDPEPWNDRYGTVHIGKSEPVATFDSTEKDMQDNTFVPVPEGEMTRFCPPRFLGCLPKDRLIAQFKVSAVEDESRVRKDDTLFEKALQLDRDVKKLLLAQVRYQKDDSTQSMDVIKGKGNNLVVLLHGPPGVGKTLTAETIAQATGRPLLNTTIADVGTEPQQAEGKLSRIFSVASRWHAILLIDEADAFLEKRDSTAAPERNAFVTVMLRILEYHTGIVMLTTNRLTTLDSAVQSRIHLAVRYEELQKTECINIFENSVRRSKVTVKQQNLDEILEWLKDNALDDQKDIQKAWNGREIRNLVTGSIASMADQGSKSLTLKHVKDVFNSTKAFKKQLEEQMWNWKRDNQGASKVSHR